jgi:Phage terminase large subunit (GpA)
VCPTYRKATLLATVRRLALGALIPPLRLHLSKWIERELVLPEGVSALPGAVRLWPYQREIANAIKDPACERVTLLKPTRVREAPRLRPTTAPHGPGRRWKRPTPGPAKSASDRDNPDSPRSVLHPVAGATGLSAKCQI